MESRNAGRIAMAIGVLGSLAAAMPARADLPEKLLFGLNQVGYNFNLSRNLIGDGYDFVADAPYAGRTFRLGMTDLTLGRTSPSTVRIDAGYTTRFVPDVRFSLATLNTPLSYTLNFRNGIQDFTATGNISFSISTRLNALGFYEQTVQISNRGTYSTEGLAASDVGSLDFDIGPIRITGNAYADLAAVLTQPFFEATGTVNPLSKISRLANKSTGYADTIESLLAESAAGKKLSDAEAGRIVGNSVLSAILGRPTMTGDLFSSLLPADALPAGDPEPAGCYMLVPEPSSVLLLGLASLALLGTSRRIS